jgi:TatD DNase family protein
MPAGNSVNLTDTHCHLDLDKFDADREAVIGRARQAGIVRILVPSLTLASSRAVLQLVEAHPMLFAAVGIHPTEAGTRVASSLQELQTLAGNKKVVAIGEVGLDYYWDTAPHDVQQQVLKEQLGLAADLALPVLLHNREKNDAESGACAEDLIRILEEWIAGLRSRNEALAERPGVWHSFSSSLEIARRATDLGFFIGVTGPVTYKNAERRRQVIADLPLERLLIETDAPFLTPQPERGKRNEPGFVRHIADKIAEIQSRTPQETAVLTTANAARLFSWGETVE